MTSTASAFRPSPPLPSLFSCGRRRRPAAGRVRCGLADLIGGDLIRPDLGRWLEDVEKHKALAIYSPHEGGYEGRYLTRLRYQGYRFLDMSARGLGDPESTLTKIHPVCPAHVGKQPIARWYFPPEVDYRLSMMPPDAKGLVLWVIEAKGVGLLLWVRLPSKLHQAKWLNTRKHAPTINTRLYRSHLTLLDS